MDRKTPLRTLSGARIARSELDEVSVEHIFPSNSDTSWWEHNEARGALLGNFSLVTTKQSAGDQKK